MSSEYETSQSNEKEEDKENLLECNICYENAHKPVLTPCGHIFCWPCLYEWLNYGHQTCPVCKGAISKESLIPIYGKGSDHKDPRDEAIPERPEGHRAPPPPQNNFFNFDTFGNLGNAFFPGYAAANVGGVNIMFGGTLGLIPLLINGVYSLARTFMTSQNTTAAPGRNNNPLWENNNNTNNANNNNNLNNNEGTMQNREQITQIIIVIVLFFLLSWFIQ
ncbi:hypothetical protein WA158_004756 [Blastocystis sp. Blastoise]